MAVNDKVDKKKGAIFRMEEVDGKLYRVMYFKNDKGGLTRSKFIREVTRKVTGSKGKRGRPSNASKQLQMQQQQQQRTQRQPRASDKYVKPSGATQNIINEWTTRSRKQ